MATTNPVTGDEIKSKPASDKYRDNYDAIFRKPREPYAWENTEEVARGDLGEDNANAD